MTLSPLPLSDVDGALTTICVGKNLYCFRSVDSTNRIAKQYADRPVAEGSVVAAEEQTCGRGRMQRSWVSSAYCDITCSIILYPDMPVDQLFSMTMISSVAVVRAVEKVCGLSAGIKWPNDVYLNGKKLCGILVEFSETGGRLSWVVAGIGINVNSDVSLYPDICGRATSLQAETGAPVARTDLFKVMLEEFDNMYMIFNDKKYSTIYEEWRRRSMVFNRTVTICSPGEPSVTGKVADLLPDGTLLLETPTGLKHIICGDVSLVL